MLFVALYSRHLFVCNRIPTNAVWHQDLILVSINLIILMIIITIKLGLESCKFFVSRYCVKFRDDIVISSQNFTVHSLALPRPVRRLSWPGY